MSHATEPAHSAEPGGRPQLAGMPALSILAYAVTVYLLFLAVLGYAVGFFAGFAVPEGIDQGPRAAVLPAAAIATATCYIMVGIALEEHDLIRSLGETYAAYRARGPALIPRPSLRRRSPGA